eukprot:408368_1
MDFLTPQTLLIGATACLALFGYQWYRVRITPLLTLVKIVATAIRLRRLVTRDSEKLSCEAAALYWLRSLSSQRTEPKPNVQKIRTMFQRWHCPVDPWAEVTSEVIEGYDGKPSVQCYWYGHSKIKSSKILLYFPGGGMCIGSAKTYARDCSNYTRALGMKVLFPEYRRCPENAFPAPVEDCLSAYMHLIQNSGRSPRDIIFFSRSAGSALAASVMLILRDRGLPLPAAALMLSPFTNLKCDFDSFTRNKANDRMLSPEITIFLRDVTMETCDLRIEDPLVSPEFGNLEGLPRLFVQAGTHEIIEDCAIEFAKKAISAGVDCELSLVECGFHGGELLTEVIPEGREQFQRSCAFVERVQREDEEEEEGRVCETVG